MLYGGGVIDGPGYYVEPTIIKMPVDAPILQIETFAPILYLIEFDTVEEAIKINNGVTQGLSSAIFTDSVSLGRDVPVGRRFGLRHREHQHRDIRCGDRWCVRRREGDRRRT